MSKNVSSIHPYWQHSIQPRLVPELEALGVELEVNEDGLMRARWLLSSDDKREASITVKLQVLPVLQYNAGWAESGKLRMENHHIIMTRQLAKA